MAQQGNFTIRVDATKAYRKLQRAAGALDAQPLLHAIGLKLIAWTDKQFQTEGRQSGEEWAPLKPNTVAGRRQGSSRILQDTGHLKGSITAKISGGSVEVGTNVSYAGPHQFGSAPYTIKPKKPGGLLAFMTVGGPVTARAVKHPGLPKRPFLAEAPKATEIAVGLINAKIEEVERRG